MKTQLFSHLGLRRIAAALFILTPLLAQAHPGHGVSWSLSAGAAHPFSGLDHMLAMVAVGLWASQQAGRARWLVPAAFVGMLVVGGLLGHAGFMPSGAEQAIAASVLVLGLLVASATRLSLAMALPLVGLFAVFHGFAHGAEMPATAGTSGYAVGFVAATALLHAIGISAGLLGQRYFGRHLQTAGWAVAATGAVLLAA